MTTQRTPLSEYTLIELQEEIGKRARVDLEENEQKFIRDALDRTIPEWMRRTKPVERISVVTYPFAASAGTQNHPSDAWRWLGCACS